jgi:hypothetical protein
VSSVELTNVVLKDVPFQTIVEADTNPVPLTMSATPVDPGFMLTGETISTNGTGLLGPLTLGVKVELSAITATGRRKPGLKQRATKRILNVEYVFCIACMQFLITWRFDASARPPNLIGKLFE